MKTLLTLILFICGLLFANAQSIDKQVVASAGETNSNANTTINSTIGEPIVGLKGSSATINQGFLAGIANNSALSTDTFEANPNVKLYPNPFTDRINISILQSQGNVNATIYNTTGKKVAQQTINATLQNISLGHLTAGMYVVQLHFTETNTHKSFKIIKK